MIAAVAVCGLWSRCLLGGVVLFLGLRLCDPRRSWRLSLAIRLSPRSPVLSGGAIVAGLSGVPPACLLVRAFVAIVCCPSLFVYIVL